MNQWRVVDQILEARPTKAGNPQIRIRTDKQEWINVSGEGVLNVRVGNKIEMSEPKQYGKSFYAFLQAIETTPTKILPASSSQNGSPTPPKQETLPEIKAAPNGKLPWAEFEAVFRAAHRLAMEVEPDSELEVQTIDRSQARAALVQTALVAFRDGRIEAPIFGEDSPEGAPPF